MPAFDMKNADFYIADGYGPTGFLVNLMAGYAIGLATMAVDGGTVTLAVGDRFTIAGETGSPIHTITAHTESMGATVSITFAPALASMIADDTALTILPHLLHIKIGEGTMSYSEKRPIVYVKDRGRLDTVRKGDEEPLDVKLDFTWEFLSSQSADTAPTIEDAFKQLGPAATWVSTSPDLCEPFAVDLYMLYSPPCTVQQKELVILPKFRYEDLAHEPKNAQVAVTGKCNVIAAVRQRAASFVF